MNQQGQKLEEYLKKQGDVEGLRLYKLHEQALSAEQPKPVKLQATTDGHPRSIFVRPARRQAFNEQLDIHRVSEANARYGAKCTVASFVSRGLHELADDRGLLEGMAKQYKIKSEHVQLYVELVQKMIHAERFPKQYDQRAAQVAGAVEKEKV
jgi:hypothetical protein